MITIGVLREVYHDDGRLQRLTVLLDGMAVAYRHGRGRHWSCRACDIRGEGDCRHIRCIRALFE